MQYDRYALKYHGNHAYLNFSHSLQEQKELSQEGDEHEEHDENEEHMEQEEHDEQHEEQHEQVEEKNDNQMEVENEMIKTEKTIDDNDKTMVSLLMGIRKGVYSRENHSTPLNQPSQPSQPAQPFSLPFPIMTNNQNIHLSVSSPRMNVSSYSPMFPIQPSLTSNMPIPVNPMIPTTDTIPVVLTSSLPPTLCCLQCSFPVYSFILLLFIGWFSSCLLYSSR